MAVTAIAWSMFISFVVEVEQASPLHVPMPHLSFRWMRKVDSFVP